MKNRSRNFLIIGLLATLTVALVAQSFYLSRLQSEVTALKTATVGSSENRAPLAGPIVAQQPGAGTFDPYSPMVSLRQLQQNMDALFENTLTAGFGLGSGFSAVTRSPRIEVTESAEDYRILIDVPENGELELSTEVEDNTVKVAGSVRIDSTENGNTLAQSFTSSSQFSRSIPLTEKVDPLAMQTDQQGGAVVITIPKA